MSFHLKNEGDIISWLLAFVCINNMAGYERCWKLEYDRSRLWIYPLLFLLLSVSPIDSSENSVLPVADANWTVILEGEWMLKL